jgi:PAS domain-containing protein
MTSLRTALLLPIALFMLLWGAYTVVVEPGSAVSPGVPLFILAVLLGVCAVDIELLLLRPLGRLKRTVQNLARGEATEAPAARGPAELREFAAGLQQFQDRVRDYEVRLVEGASRRRNLETSLRELEDLYALTVERANDGTWEWDFRSGVTLFSPRWKGMLG